jgi:UDP-N-acetylglucosamine--N-acetylmuramyl-(pentapeptide) pyrophosphoryl-undecaprenol N-acetylglucosamine transferase
VSGAFVLAAGGTGGHLFSAEALAVELISRGRQVHLLSDVRAEAFAGRVSEIEIHHVRAARLGGRPVEAAHALGELARGIVQARRLLRRLSPACAIGFGGYPSIPTMLAAVFLGVPTLIHEQNAVIGRANRLLAPRVRRIATGFPATSGMRQADRARAIHVGNPVRPTVLAVGQRGYSAPRRGGPIELLILGGSQGARIMSAAVPPALAVLPSRLREMLRVSHQARPEDLSETEAVYQKHRIQAELQSFFSDVPQRLSRAHLVICRAGASTIAELGAIGRPALLIPYPYATDDHQTANAVAFAEAGAGWVVEQSALRPDTLALRLESLFGDSAALTTAAGRAAGFGRRDAAQGLARLAIEIERHTGVGSPAQEQVA